MNGDKEKWDFMQNMKQGKPTPKSELKHGDMVVMAEDEIREIVYSPILKELVIKDIKPLSERSMSLWKI